MMEYLMENFVSIANVYMQIIIELYLFTSSLLFSYWLKPFTRKKRAAYIPALVFWILQTVNNHTGTSKEVDRMVAAGILILAFLVSWLLDNRRNPIQKIFLCVVFRLLNWTTMEFFAEIGLFESRLVDVFDWYKYSIEATVIEFFVWNTVEYGLAVLMLYLCVRILQKAYRQKADELSWRELAVMLTPAWTLLLVKPIMSSYFLLWMKGIENGSIKENIPGNPYRMLFSFLSFFPILIVITQYQKLKDRQEDEFTRKSIENQILDTHRHIDHIEDLYQKMRGMRHDLGNHLTVIERLAENGNTEELTGYIREFQNQFEELQPTIKTGNAVTDVILSEAADRCRKENITFESSFVYPEKLDVNPFDLSVILTNAMQNAIEASKMVSNPAIKIKSVQKDPAFIISVRNRVPDRAVVNEDGLPESSKRESGHGYGLKNIRSMARKYKGEIEIRQEESDGGLIFILNIMLMG